MTGDLADRVGGNIELPTAESLRLLAPHKTRKNILAPMRFVQQMSAENQYEIQTYRHVPKFVPAGQSTQMIIGATPESDYQILHVAESLYKKFDFPLHILHKKHPSNCSLHPNNQLHFFP